MYALSIYFGSHTECTFRTLGHGKYFPCPRAWKVHSVWLPKYVQVSSQSQIGRINYVGSEMDMKSGKLGMGHWKRNIKTFGVDESFWAKQQSCIYSKVGFLKWRLFFDSMHFWTCSAPSGGFMKKLSVESIFGQMATFSLHQNGVNEAKIGG